MVEEPATDGDSDHTDSEATVDSKNTCELAVTRCSFLVLWILHGFNATMSYGFEDVGMGLGTSLHSDSTIMYTHIWYYGVYAVYRIVTLPN